MLATQNHRQAPSPTCSNIPCVGAAAVIKSACVMPKDVASAEGAPQEGRARHFQRRGLSAVDCEWKLLAMTHKSPAQRPLLAACGQLPQRASPLACQAK